MPFTAHLEELRSCLIRASLAVILAFAICFVFAEKIFSFLTAPLLRTSVPGLTFIGTAVSEAFFTQIKVAFIGAIFCAFPVILRQTWRFIAPGLYEHEKHYARKFVFFGTFFFLLGAWFCYQVVFQLGYGFLLNRYQVINIRPAIKIAEYLSFSARLLLAFGVTFQFPIAVYFLTRIGLIDHRFLIRQFRYAVVFIFILAAILTPPDIVSHMLLTLPMLLLYGISVGVAYCIRQK